ncbi:MAG: hypothetical protein WCP34_16640 [Pseudomonadota bacterium]
MQAELTDKGLLIPTEWLTALGAFEIVREPQAIIILPLQAQGMIRQSITPTQQAQSHSARGKYAFVNTSSEAFAMRKAKEIALEDKS